MAKSKNRETLQAYNKQRKRIQQFIRRAERRGYQFAEGVLPDKPSRITQASVRRLEKLTPDVLYKKAQYGGEATFGEIVSAEEGRKAERSVRSTKAAQTRKYRAQEPVQESTNTPGFEVPEYISYDDSLYDVATIAAYKAHVKRFNEKASTLLLSWLDRIITEHGAHDTAVMLNYGIEYGMIVDYTVVYDPVMLHNYMHQMLDYLPEAGPLFKAKLMDAMEEEEALLGFQ